MSDGMTDGLRAERLDTERRRKISEFFSRLERFLEGQLRLADVMLAFDAFLGARCPTRLPDAQFFGARDAHSRALQEACLAAFMHDDPGGWAEVLTLAFRFASPETTARLQARSKPYASCVIGVCMPPDRRGKVAVSDTFADALDAIKEGGAPSVFHIEDPLQAILAAREAGSGEAAEKYVVRFIAVPSRT